MKGNASAGILLLLLAAFMITVGASSKTKEIMSLLFNGGSTTDNLPTYKEVPNGKVSGGATAPGGGGTPGAYAGEKGATVA